MKNKIHILRDFWGYASLILLFIAGYITGIYFYFGDTNLESKKVIIVVFTFSIPIIFFLIFIVIKAFRGSLFLGEDEIYIKSNVTYYLSLIIQYKFSLRYKKIKAISCSLDRCDSRGREFKIGVPWKRIKRERGCNYDYCHYIERFWLILTDDKGKNYRICLRYYNKKDYFGVLDEIAERIRKAQRTKDIDAFVESTKKEMVTLYKKEQGEK